MNKIFKTFVSIAAGAVMLSAAALTVSAEDVELNIEASQSTGSWGQSVKYLTSRNADQPDAFDPTTMTADSVVQVSYESDLDDDNNHIELIWQTWGDHTTAVAADWNKAAPSDHSKGYTEFTFDDIVSVYGTDDFSEVYAICVGDTGDTPITVTSIKITNVSAAGAAAVEETEAETEEETEAETEEETEAETEEETEAETEEETEAETEEETEAETEEETETETEEETEAETETETSAAAEEEASVSTETDSGGVILIVVIIVVVIAIGVVIFLIKNKGNSKGDNDDWKR